MKNGLLAIVVILFASGMSAPLFAGGQRDVGDNRVTRPSTPGVTTVEIVYLNHGPVRSVLTEIDNLLGGYGEQVHITRYDFNTTEGEAFAKSQGLSGHIPLAIFVNGLTEFTVNERSVKFFSFPQGQGTGMVPDGAWNIDDLKQVLDRMVVKN